MKIQIRIHLCKIDNDNDDDDHDVYFEDRKNGIIAGKTYGLDQVAQ